MKQAWVLRFRIVLILSLLLGVLSPASQIAQAQSDAGARARTLLASLTPEEKVGQLFLVTFTGSSLKSDAPILDLISNRHIGGVVLQSSNDNFSGGTDAVTQAAGLISTLQTAEWENAQQSSGANHYVPLLVGMSQEGDSAPNDQLFTGMTALPSQMALGATWNTTLAERTGEVMGKELSALGVNLLLGPSLDVMDEPHTDGREDLGVQVFGGDPYWVGVMGQAYIRGLHTGSNNALAVIGKNFPGRGASDRPAEKEVATVRKAFEQLENVELAPFAAVTGKSISPETTLDGLLVSHIRYQGLQGQVNANTRPVSLDATALDTLMNLGEFTTWRSSGGVLISDNLGSNAVRQLFDPTGSNFDGRQVARSAFLAGNDLLYVDNFVSSGDPDAYTTLERTLDFFVQKYREDAAFAERVDTSVERILTLKFRLYPNFTLQTVLAPQQNLPEVGQSGALTFEVAQKAATLISPDAADLAAVLPRPPATNERIVFLTDVQVSRQCSNCADQSILALDALQSAVLRLYGPQASGQVVSTRTSSHSFAELTRLLDKVDIESTIEADLQQAAWIVVAMRGESSDRAESRALTRLLTERPNLIQDKKIIVFAFGAPYYLDATDLSKISAYYALYSKTTASIDVAARILFQELSPTGASPVSVPGAGYTLSRVLSPDPNQVIPLSLDIPETGTPAANVTPMPTEVPTFKVGDTLPLKTGMILDHNKNTIPDGTIVQFLFTTGGDNAVVQQISSPTTAGVARASFRIQNPGLVEIRVVSEPALTSQILSLDVSGEQAAAVTAIVPTALTSPSATPEPLPSPTIESTPEPTRTLSGNTRFLTWLLTVGFTWLCAVGIFTLGRLRVSLRWGVRWGLLAAIGGLAIYSIVEIFLEDRSSWLAKGPGGGIFLALCGILLGWALGIYWQRRIQNSGKHTG
ncbi:beta-glucosidase-related glycosidase [Longilinea arvoryzae]|uniref:beta-N-acetylhexosaminidase n=1 Tax=Longilinea arvoryzae TaxID=360412 RepID=A0A0S7BFF6_9CHLR|nr:glycoside hydrolase family 3 N-terminal domain-containing protein [Longilinea arvoryzae]GAP14233.1 beta-glucosidase-related glycosidase [Longilinea arvoryzae]